MQGGTAQGDVNLCKSCTYGHRRRYANNNNEVTVCSAIFDAPYVVPGPVAECSDYKDAKTPALHAMKEIAWFISVDKKQSFTGFLDPKAAKKAAKDGKLDTDVEENF